MNLQPTHSRNTESEAVVMWDRYRIRLVNSRVVLAESHERLGPCRPGSLAMLLECIATFTVPYDHVIFGLEDGLCIEGFRCSCCFFSRSAASTVFLLFVRSDRTRDVLGSEQKTVWSSGNIDAQHAG